MNNGPHPPPGQLGARYVIREDGRRINLAFLKKESDRRLELGDKARGKTKQWILFVCRLLSVDFIFECAAFL